MRIKIFLVRILFILGSFFPIANAADFSNSSSDTLVFPYERKTFLEGEKSVSYRIRNATSNTPYLVQATMEKLDESKGVQVLSDNSEIPFMITPPLHKLEAGQSYHWRVMFIGNPEKLPKDRESIYIAKFRAIPPLDEKIDEKKESTVFTSIQALHFKVYYRPKSLEKLKVEEEQSKLTFKVEGDNVVVTSSSPIYMYFDTLNIGGVEVDSDQLFKPLVPLSEQKFKLNGKPKGKEVVYSILDDLVLPLPAQTMKLK
ncbi:molecular chaperone [Providencia rettgeri]